MQMSHWVERLLAGTRGDVIALLRRSGRTVNELADELGVTDNAIRSHLASLERDGLVEQHQGVPSGVGKPAFRYTLTPEGDALLPKAYGPVLGLLLVTLAAQMKPEELESLLRDVGRLAGAGRAQPGDDLRTRIAGAHRVLGEMGGVADVEEVDGTTFIRGYSCPLAALVAEHPQVCQLAEAMVSELVGVPVRERCQKGERPRCCFEIRG